MDKDFVQIVLNYAARIIKKNPQIPRQELKEILLDEFGPDSKKIVNQVIKTIYNEKSVSIKKASNILRKARNKIKKWGDIHVPDPIKPVYARLLVILDLLADIIDKNYKASAAAVTCLASALVYLVFPLDLLPDFIPAVGFIDDAGIICLVFYTLENMIISYCKEKKIDINALNNGDYKKLDEN